MINSIKFNSQISEEKNPPLLLSKVDSTNQPTKPTTTIRLCHLRLTTWQGQSALRRTWWLERDWLHVQLILLFQFQKLINYNLINFKSLIIEEKAVSLWRSPSRLLRLTDWTGHHCKVVPPPTDKLTRLQELRRTRKRVRVKLLDNHWEKK